MSKKKKSKQSYGFLKAYSPSPPERRKFKLGDDPVSLYENKHQNPVFSFQYISMNRSEKSFSNPSIQKKDYHSFLERLKTIADVSYQQMDQGGISYRFHSVDFNDEKVTVTESEFRKALMPGSKTLNEENTPTLYQFSITGKQRAFGFLGYYGTFYLVWFDYDHSIYS